MSCNTDLNHLIFSDSKICKKTSCGQTKAGFIAKNVLCPFSISNHLLNFDEELKFSISSDASNKGNIKLYPLALRYFTKVLGIRNFILDFYEESNCTAIGIYKSIGEISKENNLKMHNLISYGGDSAAVNYGIHNSVFTNLQNENDFLVKANCHLLHNTSKYALIKHPLDIETLISKIYN
jgi:hypothetical protein